jgi:hypothetical protein
MLFAYLHEVPVSRGAGLPDSMSDDKGSLVSVRRAQACLNALGKMNAGTDVAATQVAAAGLEALSASLPDVAADLLGPVEDASEKDLQSNDALRLLKVWQLHGQGSAAERDYHLSAFPLAEQRSAIRAALGFAPPRHLDEVAFLITVDCLRADRLSCNGHSRPTSPAIDALAADGVNFSRAYSTAGHTYLSFPGILLSNFYQNFGASRLVPEHLVTLAQALSAHGFYTAGFNAANPLISRFYDYDRGFDEFHDFLGEGDYKAGDQTYAAGSQLSEAEADDLIEQCSRQPRLLRHLEQTAKRRGRTLRSYLIIRSQVFHCAAPDIIREVLKSLSNEQGRARRFSWLHLMDVHEDIAVPFSRLGQFTAPEQIFLNTCMDSRAGQETTTPHIEEYRSLYDTAVSYVDVNVEILRNFLADAGVLDRALICVTADHGQELLEHGRFGHGQERVHEKVLHVPLVFGGGLASRMGRSALGRPVSTLDIGPTFLDVLGARDVPETFLGTSLNDARPRPVYVQSFYGDVKNRARDDGSWWRCQVSERPGPVKEHCQEIFGCIEGDYQLVHDVGRDETQLTRLEAAGPAPEASPPPDPDRLRRQAKEYLDSVHHVPEHAGVSVMSEEDRGTVQARLQDLGYL